MCRFSRILNTTICVNPHPPKKGYFQAWSPRISKTGLLLICEMPFPKGLSHAVCSAWNVPPHLLARLIITFPSSPFLKWLHEGSLSWLFRPHQVSCSACSEHQGCCFYRTSKPLLWISLLCIFLFNVISPSQQKELQARDWVYLVWCWILSI